MEGMNPKKNILSQSLAQDVLTARLYSDIKGKRVKLGTSSSSVRLDAITTSNNTTTNRLKPKSILGSSSMPSLLSKQTTKRVTSTINVKDNSLESKNELIKNNDDLGVGINIVSTKTLYSSASGASLIGATTSRFLSTSSSNFDENKSSSPLVMPYFLVTLD